MYYYNHEELSAIHSTCLKGDIDGTEKLLKWDKSWANQRNENGLTPLHMVVTSADGTVLEDLTNLLIYFGADPNSRSSVTGETPMHSVISYGRLESAEVVIPILLRAGANPRIINKLGQSSIDAAVVHNYLELARLLSDYPNDPSVLEKWEENHGQQKSSPPPAKEEPKKQPESPPLNNMLLNAVIRGDKKMVEELLKRGASINFKNEEGFCALHYAVSRCATDRIVMTEILVNNMADVNATTQEKDTPLTLAIKKNHTEMEVYNIVKCLLDNGANDNFTDLDGRSPLLLAQERLLEKVVALLTNSEGQPSAPADPNAFDGPYHQVHELCQDPNLDQNKRTEQLEPEFKKGVYIDIRTKEERDTCLIIACRRQDKPLVEYLLEKNATVDVTNAKKESPLSITQQLKNEPIKALLIEAQKRQQARSRWRKAGVVTQAAKGKSCNLL